MGRDLVYFDTLPGLAEANWHWLGKFMSYKVFLSEILFEQNL